MDKGLHNVGLGDLLEALIQRFQYETNPAASRSAEVIIEAVSEIDRGLAALRQDLATFSARRDRTEQDLLEQLLDLRHEVSQQRAVLDRVGSARQHTETALAREPAIQALILAGEQLDRVLESTEGELHGIVRGQRSNLHQTLAQLGVRPIAPESGETFDPSRHRSSSQTAPTGDSQLDERVSGLIRSGWETTGGGLFQHADVILYAFQAPDPQSAIPADPPAADESVRPDGPVGEAVAADVSAAGVHTDDPAPALPTPPGLELAATSLHQQPSEPEEH